MECRARAVTLKQIPIGNRRRQRNRAPGSGSFTLQSMLSSAAAGGQDRLNGTAVASEVEEPPKRQDVPGASAGLRTIFQECQHAHVLLHLRRRSCLLYPVPIHVAPGRRRHPDNGRSQPLGAMEVFMSPPHELQTLKPETLNPKPLSP